MDGIICISHSRDTVLGRKSGKYTPDESGVKLEENLQAKHSALSAVDDNTSN